MKNKSTIFISLLYSSITLLDNEFTSSVSYSFHSDLHLFSTKVLFGIAYSTYILHILISSTKFKISSQVPLFTPDANVRFSFAFLVREKQRWWKFSSWYEEAGVRSSATWFSLIPLTFAIFQLYDNFPELECEYRYRGTIFIHLFSFFILFLLPSKMFFLCSMAAI